MGLGSLDVEYRCGDVEAQTTLVWAMSGTYGRQLEWPGRGEWRLRVSECLSGSD